MKRQREVVAAALALCVLGLSSPHASAWIEPASSNDGVWDDNTNERLAIDPAGKPGVDNFLGTAVLSGCSGALVRWTDSVDTDKAMFLSNAHCRDIEPKDGEWLANKPERVAVGFVDERGKEIGETKTTTLLYATETGTDVSLWELDLTWQQIQQKYKSPGLVIANRHPVLGQQMTLPSSYKEKIWKCPADGVSPMLFPNGLQGVWSLEAVRGDRRGACSGGPGTSGSPMVDMNTGEVIAIHNAGNDAKVNGCKGDAACEVFPDGRRVGLPNVGYAVPTYWFYTCRNAQGRFDIKTPGCKLTGGDQAVKRPSWAPKG